MSSTERPLVEARELVRSFLWRAPLGRTRRLVAVDRVDLEVGHGECLGLVGESGSGKTTLGLLLARLLEPDSGTIRFAGVDLLAARGANLRHLRRRLQMVFQDSAAAFDPRWRVGEILAEPLRLHQLAAPGEEAERVRSLLADVGLGESVLARYPHQLSGGQRQRLAVARALALEPQLLVLDEPVAALDVSVQAQILHLLQELRRRLGLAMVFISHDLAVVEQIAERVAVLYLGRVVEVGPREEIFRQPLHPYTASLLASVPVADPRHRRPAAALQGEIPSPLDPPLGCRFHPRCPIARARCRSEEPELLGGERRSGAACHYPGEMTVPANDGRG